VRSEFDRIPLVTHEPTVLQSLVLRLIVLPLCSTVATAAVARSQLRAQDKLVLWVPENMAWRECST
jgi:hypothetical protein